MKKLFAVAAVILAGVLAWRVLHTLSSDAISMALGMFLGVVAGIPTALVLLSSSRRSEHPSGRTRHPRRQDLQPMATHAPASMQQPPVIIVMGPQGTLPSQSQAASFPVRQQETHWQTENWQNSDWPSSQAHPTHQSYPSGRTFRIVGEPEHRGEA